MDELAQLALVCERLGAPKPQAEVMARQLLKRAEQLAVERKQTREQALEWLLRLTIKGRRGEVPSPHLSPQAHRKP